MSQKVHYTIRNYKFKFKQFPSFVFFLGQVGLNSKFSSYYVNGELNSLKILNLMFIDSCKSMDRVSNHVLIYTKSQKTHFFIMRLFIEVFLRFFFLKKKKFFLKITETSQFAKYFSVRQNKHFSGIYCDYLRLMLKKKLIDTSIVHDIKYTEK